MQNQQPFNLISVLVLAIVIIVGLATIYFFSWKEQKRMSRENKYPSAGKLRKIDAEVERLLGLDEHEQRIS